MHNILILNDFVSKGKIAGNMMDAVLSYKNFSTYFLPTALISNNFAFGEVALLDTTQFIKDSLRVFDNLGFRFDVIFIGFLAGDDQAKLISDYIDNLDYKPLIILDPIMADNGKLYEGVGEEKINIYKNMIEKVDIIIPNHTEAKFLGLEDYESLKDLPQKFLITSVEGDDSTYNLAIDSDIEKIAYNKIDVYLTGTGDLFDGLFIENYIKTHNFTRAIKHASDNIRKIIRAQITDHPGINDIYIEKYLDLVD